MGIVFTCIPKGRISLPLFLFSQNANRFPVLEAFSPTWFIEVNIEGVMIAARQNLKRLLKHRLEEHFCFFREIIEFIWR